MRYPLIVTREAINAIEKDTGFVGIGDRMIRAGHWKLEEQCKKTAMGPTLISPRKQQERMTPTTTLQA